MEKWKDDILKNYNTVYAKTIKGFNASSDSVFRKYIIEKSKEKREFTRRLKRSKNIQEFDAFLAEAGMRRPPPLRLRERERRMFPPSKVISRVSQKFKNSTGMKIAGISGASFAGAAVITAAIKSKSRRKEIDDLG